MVNHGPECAHRRFFDQHEAWTETKNCVFVRWKGRVRGEDIDAVAELIQLLAETANHLTLIQDVSAVDGFTPEARKKIINNKSTDHLNLVILVGASFQVRIIQVMINRAMRLLHEGTALTLFWETFAQARRIAEEQRNALPSSKDRRG